MLLLGVGVLVLGWGLDTWVGLGLGGGWLVGALNIVMNFRIEGLTVRWFAGCFCSLLILGLFFFLSSRLASLGLLFLSPMSSFIEVL